MDTFCTIHGSPYLKKKLIVILIILFTKYFKANIFRYTSLADLIIIMCNIK